MLGKRSQFLDTRLGAPRGHYSAQHSYIVRFSWLAYDTESTVCSGTALSVGNVVPWNEAWLLLLDRGP